MELGPACAFGDVRSSDSSRDVADADGSSEPGWQQMLNQLRRDDCSEIYQWLSQEAELGQFVQKDGKRTLLHALDHSNYANLAFEVCRILQERAFTEDFKSEMKLELLRFESESAESSKTWTTGWRQELEDSWNFFLAKHVDDIDEAEEAAKRASDELDEASEGEANEAAKRARL